MATVNSDMERQGDLLQWGPVLRRNLWESEERSFYCLLDILSQVPIHEEGQDCGVWANGTFSVASFFQVLSEGDLLQWGPVLRRNLWESEERSFYCLLDILSQVPIHEGQDCGVWANGTFSVASFFQVLSEGDLLQWGPVLRRNLWESEERSFYCLLDILSQVPIHEGQDCGVWANGTFSVASFFQVLSQGPQVTSPLQSLEI
eukprot:TRINITY_DN2998_c0_g1_i2.p1 TRINITY_DN2998_c0_g1~~TRINITY_DN2998_c0_g1_i2.p1  ORF type:complete len:203 (-),score=34.54 TRINITY_DN2998_c0_g1_i2:1396-2004(-)